MAVFLMMLEAESVVKDTITLMVDENYFDITLEEVILTYTSYARDLDMSKQTEKELAGKRSKAGKAKVKSEEFGNCHQEGNHYKCSKDCFEVKYKGCAKHNKNVTERTVSTKIVSIVSKFLYLDYKNACTTTMDMFEKDMYEEALWCRENSEEFDDVKVCKIGSVILVNSGVAFTSVNESIELQNLKNISFTRLEYAAGGVGSEIKTEGNVMLNGHKIPAYMSPDLNQNMFSTPQVDRCLGGAAIQFNSESINFVIKKKYMVERIVLLIVAKETAETDMAIVSNLEEYRAVFRRSTLVAQSPTEVEFYCLAEACREMLWIRLFIHEILEEIPCKKLSRIILQRSIWCLTRVSTDDISTLTLNFKSSGEADFPHINSPEMFADIFTKELSDDIYPKHATVMQGFVSDA